MLSIDKAGTSLLSLSDAGDVAFSTYHQESRSEAAAPGELSIVK